MNHSFKHSKTSLPTGLWHTTKWKPDLFLGMLKKTNTYALVSIGLDGETTPLFEFENKFSFSVSPDWRDNGHRPTELSWLSQRQSLHAIDSDGKHAVSIDLSENRELALEQDEEIGEMLATEESLFLSINRGLNNRDKQSPKYDLTSRLVKLSLTGEVLWSTKLPTSKIVYGGVSYRSAATNWKTATCPPWFPTTWKPFGHDLLLVSGRRVMATLAETSSGVGCRYILDFDSGSLIWKSEHSAGGHSVSIGNGEFLIGDQGYGEFKTRLFRNDQVDMSWPSHGYSFRIGEKLISIQMANVSSQPQHLVEMKMDGAISKQSEPLGGYYTSRPQQAKDDIYFWRANKIWKWSPREGISHVLETSFDDNAFATPIDFNENLIGFHVRSDRKGFLLVLEL